MKKYRIIIADPPWNYSNSSARGAAENHYPTMKVDEICNLPVEKVAHNDSILLLWCTWPQLKKGLQVVESWGFEYITGFPWIKIVGEPRIDLWGELQIKPQYGVGFWVRGCSEIIMIGKRGNVSPETGNFVGLLSENFGHSRKPDNLHDFAETMQGPYLEMFARRSRDGWDVFGNEAENSIKF
jgi:N6-adenosine-specific RNA methylase IME4